MNTKQVAIIVLSTILLFSMIIIPVFCADYTEDFNDGTRGVFLYNQVGSDFWSMESTIKHEGAYGIKHYDNLGGSSGGFYSDDNTFLDSDTDSYSFWIYINAISGGGFAIYGIRSNFLEITLTFSNDGSFYAWDGDLGANVEVCEYPEDEWLLVQVYYDNPIFSVYLNDATISLIGSLEDVTRRHLSYPAYDDILFYSGSGTLCTVYIDYISSPSEEPVDTYYLDYVSSQTNSTDYDILENCNFTSIWDTNSTMSAGVFCWNYTGSYVNDTLVSLGGSEVFSTIKFLGGEVLYNGTIISWCMYANTTTNNYVSSGFINFTLTYYVSGGYSEDDLESYFVIGVILSGFVLILLVVAFFQDKKMKRRI